MPLARTIANAVERFPKVIHPRTHAALDYFTAAAFFIAAGLFWRGNRRAAASALINGKMVLGMSLLTDYDGDGHRPISFPTHGKLDVVQAGLAATLPSILGFSHKPGSLFFRMQSMNELMVVALTDWESKTRRLKVVKSGVA